MRSTRRRAFLAAVALAGAAALGCKSLPPVVASQSLAPRESALRKLAVFPLRASEAVLAQAPASGESASLVARGVGSALAQALLAQGVDVVPPSAVEGAGLGGSARTAPLLDPVTASQQAARRFGASAVLLGTLQRWRERAGNEAAAAAPASVAFALALYEAPSGRRLWAGRFDQTQHAANVRPLEAARYPGGGTRWLTATELSRWGVEEAVKALIAEP